jgi:uncharacterized protein
MKRDYGVFFLHGQKGNQFTKVDRKFSDLDLWRWRFVAGVSSGPFRLARCLKLGDRRGADTMKRDAAYWIQKLSLQPHPEGGYYRETYSARLVLAKESLPHEFSGRRPASTAIYFLLEGENFSAFHRLRSDEMWHFYVGSPLVVHVIETEGRHLKIQLGNDPEAGQALQAVVKAGCWFASSVKDGKSFALVGCTVAPGFDFEDFELAKRDELSCRYPDHRELIKKLTRI